MTGFTLSDIMDLISQHGYVIFFLFSVIEGPIVTVIASFLASLGKANVFIIYVLSLLGDAVGDSIYYYIGHHGKSYLKKGGSFFGLTKEKIAPMEEHFKQHPAKTLLLAKLTHGAGFTVLISAGLAQMNFWKFLLYNFLGTIPKSLFFVVLGYYFGKAYYTIDTYLYYWSIGIVMMIMATITTHFVRKKITKEEEIS